MMLAPQFYQPPFKIFRLSPTHNEFADINPHNTAAMCARTQFLMEQAHATLGIGLFKESRQLYQAFPQFELQNKRTVHLGLDLTLPIGTAIHAPLDSIVVAKDYQSAIGDYGAVMMLAHEYQNQTTYSLYGHISQKDLRHWQIGDSIKQYQPFAHVGQVHENGGWPPHVHIQALHDHRGLFTDYPGVCSRRDQDDHLKNCFNPNLWLKLPCQTE